MSWPAIRMGTSSGSVLTARLLCSLTMWGHGQGSRQPFYPRRNKPTGLE